MSLNTCSLVGRLTANPELRTVGEHEVSRFTIAVNEGYGDKERTNFIDCEVWGKTASFANEYCKKGNLVALSGRLRQDTWEKDGKKFSKLMIVGNTLENLSPKPKDTNLDDGDIPLSSIPF